LSGPLGLPLSNGEVDDLTRYFSNRYGFQRGPKLNRNAIISDRAIGQLYDLDRKNSSFITSPYKLGLYQLLSRQGIGN
jgi:hypothetical protein